LELAGIDFKKFNQKGIEIDSFGEMLTTSGLVLNENVKWITFHGSYDFSYLIKALSNQPLPTEESSFNEYLNLYFCNYYDVRQLLKNISWLKGSLSRISNDLDIKRIGQSHQAGSDSLITSKVFFKLLSNYGDQIDIYGDKNKLFGFAYKLIDDYDRYSTYPNNFPNYPGISQYLGVSMQNGLGMNPMNVGSLSTNGLNTMSQANTGLNNSKLASNKSISNPNMHNLIYFQNMNNLSNINSYNNFSTANMNNMGNINNMNFIYNSSNIPGFNNIYQPQVDPYFYGNFYNGGNTNGTVSGSFKQPNLGNNTLNNISANPNLKESKFISQS
jgi:CCR4-NOT transcription complex subunit 7/8